MIIVSLEFVVRSSCNLNFVYSWDCLAAITRARHEGYNATLIKIDDCDSKFRSIEYWPDRKSYMSSLVPKSSGELTQASRLMARYLEPGYPNLVDIGEIESGIFSWEEVGTIGCLNCSSLEIT